MCVCVKRAEVEDCFEGFDFLSDDSLLVIYLGGRGGMNDNATGLERKVL